LPKSPALRSSLWGLNRARLLTAAIVVAVGALLRFTEAFPYPFDTFAMTVLGGAAACLVLPLGERRGVPLERIVWFQFGVDAILITGSDNSSPLALSTSTTVAPRMRFWYFAEIVPFSNSLKLMIELMRHW